MIRNRYTLPTGISENLMTATLTHFAKSAPFQSLDYFLGGDSWRPVSHTATSSEVRLTDSAWGMGSWLARRSSTCKRIRSGGDVKREARWRTLRHTTGRVDQQSWEENIMMIAILVLTGLAVISLALSVKVIRQYQRGVIFRLGRIHKTKPPGLRFIIPIIDWMVRVDIRTRTLDIKPQARSPVVLSSSAS